MRRTPLAIIALLSFTASAWGETDGYGPWKFGMSPDAVSSVDKFGPYKPVRATGGVETSGARWDGRRANVSFLFKDGELDKIQIWAYEGKDRAAALGAWWRVADYLRKTHGKLEFKQFPELPAEVGEGEFLKHFKAQLDAGGGPKFQMGLAEMPEGAIVFSSLFVHPVHGYYVFLFYRRA